jgi:hypothetical protein
MRDTMEHIRSLATEAKMSNIRQTGVNLMVEENNTYNFYMVMFESLFFIAICGAQIYYVKNLLENKRVI